MPHCPSKRKQQMNSRKRRCKKGKLKRPVRTKSGGKRRCKKRRTKRRSKRRSKRSKKSKKRRRYKMGYGKRSESFRMYRFGDMKMPAPIGSASF